MSEPIRFGDCRSLRPLERQAKQLELFAQKGPRPLLEPCCARCGRALYMAIVVDGTIEGRCDWHVLERPPLRVRKRSFR